MATAAQPQKATANDQAAASSTMTAKRVKRGSWRSNPAYKQLGMIGNMFDVFVMNLYDQLVAQGGSALWALKATSNGSFYLFPERESKELILVQSPNGYQAHVSNETSGIIATLFALNRLAWSPQGQPVHDQLYHALFAYALELPEGGLVHAILD